MQLKKDSQEERPTCSPEMRGHPSPGDRRRRPRLEDCEDDVPVVIEGRAEEETQLVWFFHQPLLKYSTSAESLQPAGEYTP